MLRKALLGVALTMSFTGSTVGQAASQTCNAVIIGLGSVPNFAESLAIRLEPLGGAVVHYFPPQVAIGFIPEKAATLLLLDPMVDTICYTRVNPDEWSLPSASKAGLGAWNYFLDLQEGLVPQSPANPPPASFGNDNRYPRGSEPEASEGPTDCPFGPLSVPPEERFTSNYMIGKVAVGIFLMESNGQAENWTSPEEQNVINEILQATNRLSVLAKNASVNLTWVYETHLKVPTGFEPIQGNSKPSFNIFSGWDFAWVGDALAYVGYNTNWCGYYDYVNDLRARSKTDWAYGVFVVRDQNDPDHRFANGDFAVTYDNSLMIMTYNNDNWHPVDMDLVFQHETAHAFLAADEDNAQCGSGDCFNPYGYLGIANGNCETCNSAPVDCLLRSQKTEVYCFYTLGQIGWRDFDGDGPNDPIDPHTGYWASMFPVVPGDRVSIALIENFVKSIAVTTDNMGATSGDGFIIWDATSDEYAEMVPQTGYYWSRNTSPKQSFALWTADPNVIPVISNFQKTTDQKLNWTLSNSFAYVRCRVLNSSGVEVLNPIRDKMFASMQIYQIDLRPLPIGTNYLAEFLAWRPDGANYTTSFTFNRDPLPVNVPTITASQTNTITVNWTDNNSWEDGYTVERKDATSSWTQIALLPKNSASCWDTPPLGSETYTYRVKAFNVDVSAYSNEVTITTKPKPPGNFSAQVVWESGGGGGMMMMQEGPPPGEDPVPTTKVILSWNAPSNQKIPIDSYRVEVYGYLTRCVWCCCWGNCQNNCGLWPTLEQTSATRYTKDTLCLSVPDTIYDFYIKSFAGNDSSLIWIVQSIPGCIGGDCDQKTLVGPTAEVVTGSYCVCNSCHQIELSKSGTSAPPTTSPKEFALGPSYPNPFNPSTTIRYALPQAAKVELKIYNILGQVVRKLVDEEQAAGFYEKLWDGKDQNGRPVSTGIYLYQIRAGDFVQSKKMQLIK